MAEMNDHPESVKYRLGHLSVENLARAVVISNIPREITEDEIHIYFQKSKHGGGEVDDIWMVKEGEAVIVFENPEVADSVLKRPHVLGGKKVDLRPYNTQVFSRVAAFVSFDTMSPRKSENLLEMVKEKVPLSWQAMGHNGFVLLGSINQLELAHSYMQEFFLRRPYLLFNGERIVQGKDAVKAQQNSAENFKQAKEDSQEIVQERTFEVEPKFMKLFKRVHKEKLEQIERESHLEIVWAENEARVKIKPTPLTKETQYQEGCNAFIDLYQTVHQSMKMKRQVVDVKDIYDDGKTKEAIAFVESKHPVVIEKVEGQLIVYCEEIRLKSSVQALKKMLELSKMGGDNPRHGQRNIRQSPHHHEEPLPKILRQNLTNNVIVSLYQGDITDEKVDAIVNPANAWLQHSQGVAGAIVKKGGSQVEEESQYIMSHRNFPLQPGEAVCTRGGKMACHYIIHTVGPNWSAYADKSFAVVVLRVACIECLRLAVRLQLSSVALPAISSGNFGMPKEVCARAIFRAIDEFSTSTDAECSTLRDIRVVIIDTETTEVFRREFMNRYCSGQKSQNQMATRRSPSSEEGERPFSTNLGRGDPGIDDELINEKRKSTQDNYTDSMRKQQGDDSHQQVEEYHQQTFKESNLKADKWTLADSVEAQIVGGGKNDTKRKDEGRDTDERHEKTTKGSGNSVPGRGILAPNFSRKGEGVRKGASVGRAMSHKPTREIKHPPGLSASEDALNIVKKLMEVADNEQFTDTFDVKNVNRPDANKQNTNEEEDKPPDTSQEGNELVYPCNDLSEPSASDPVHSNSMSYKPIRAINHLPGLPATDNGHNIAEKLMEVENKEQYTEACDVKNVNRTDVNKQNTNKKEDKPPDKSEEGNELVYPCNDVSEPSASDPVHSNSMSYKPTRAINHPPGLSATNDSHNIAKKLMEVADNEQFTDAFDVENVNRPDANKQNTNEEEDMPPDTSQEGNELVYPCNDLSEPSASGLVHSNSSAPKTEETEREIKMPLEITPDPTNASASGKVNAPNDVRSSAAGTTQGPGHNTGKEKEPGVSSREASPAERDEDLMNVTEEVTIHRPNVSTPLSSAFIRGDLNAATRDQSDGEIQIPLEITSDPTNASASGKVNAPIDVPLSVADVTQGPGQNTGKEKDPGVSSREASTVERDEDQSQGGQIITRGDHFVVSLCSVCHNSCQALVEPLKCGHTFCQSCVHHTSNDVFVCGNQWCVCERSQPIGTMSWRTEKQSLRGYDDCHTIAVTYNFPPGIQGWQHPAQGQPYRERYFTTYLPNNSEGQKVCQLLKRAFEAQLLFTIGKCQATGEENQIVCNGFEHKINRSGGLANHGYPDSTYLNRVKEQLAKIGIIDDADLQV